jgi:WD repeat-containing protein 35
MEAIELYRKANRNTESARLLTNIAKEMSKSQVDLILLKKIYVMAALEVDSYKRRVLDA